MEKLKTRLKEMLPGRILYHIYLMSAVREYMYDIKIRVRDKTYNKSTKEKLIRDLTLAYHIVEKGLTMPSPRPGFGHKVVSDLCNLVFRYSQLNFPVEDMAFRQSVSVLKEYAHYHKQINYTLEKNLDKSLRKISSEFSNIEGLKQKQVTRAEYFADKGKPFDKFCYSRYSVRNYTDKKIPAGILMNCIEMAQRSPSFCNRQPSRVHVVQSEEKKKRILELQNGNRGFGHLASTLLVITSVVSAAKDIFERNENHLNSGMFSMTLLNALHYNEIAACSLNWSVSHNNDRELRKLLDIPPNELIILVISCGYPPDNFSLASSPRRSAEEITVMHL